MHGFLPYSRAPLMHDLVAVAMLLVIPVLAWSIWIVRNRKAYRLHRAIQLTLGTLLLLAVLAFEIEVRIHGWRQHATASPFYNTLLFPVLYTHLFFSISCCVLWCVNIGASLKWFAQKVHPNAYSAIHRRLGKLTAVSMGMTAMTGWVFYYMAFVAS